MPANHNDSIDTSTYDGYVITKEVHNMEAGYYHLFAKLHVKGDAADEYNGPVKALKFDSNDSPDSYTAFLGRNASLAASTKTAMYSEMDDYLGVSSSVS